MQMMHMPESYEARARLSILLPGVCGKKAPGLAGALSPAPGRTTLLAMENPFESKRLWGVLLACASVLAACAKPEPPTIAARSARVSSVGPSGLTLAVELDVHNPNSFPLAAHGVDGSLELGDGVELGRAHAAPEAAIPAKESRVVQSELTVNFSNLGALTPFLLLEKPVPYTFKGQAQIGSERLNVGVPFELRGELTRAELLQIGLRGLGNLPR
jgi:LEA14-like dessication related protein